MPSTLWGKANVQIRTNISAAKPDPVPLTRHLLRKCHPPPGEGFFLPTHKFHKYEKTS